MAAALRPRNVNVLSGYPELHGHERARCLDTLAENLRVAADLMGEIGIGVVVEAVNTVDRPGFLLWRPASRRSTPSTAPATPIYRSSTTCITWTSWKAG